MAIAPASVAGGEREEQSESGRSCLEDEDPAALRLEGDELLLGVIVGREPFLAGCVPCQDVHHQ